MGSLFINVYYYLTVGVDINLLDDYPLDTISFYTKLVLYT